MAAASPGSRLSFLFHSSRESITVGALVFASSALAPRSLALARVGGNASVPRPDRTMSVIDRFPHSTAELRRVKAVQFGVLSPDEIVRVVPRCEIRSSPAKKQDSRVA